MPGGSGPAAAEPLAPLLSVRGLTVTFPGPDGERVSVVDGASFDVARGEIVALVGESGSGKSVTALALLDLVPEPGLVEAGEVVFEGRDVRALAEPEKRRLRGGGIGLVFQEPGAALDPVRRIGDEVAAVVRRHRGLGRREAREEAVRWLARVALPEPERRMEDWPHRMSGGMRQRAMVALALAGGPRLLVADEPTTALDVTIQAQLLALLRRLRDELSLTVLLITHDLGVVAELAERVVVMYAGEIVEEAPVGDLFRRPAHPYTRALLAARPGRPGAAKGHLPAIDGSIPEPGRRPAGCAFSPRCREALPRCSRARPALLPLPERRGRAACFLWEEREEEP